MSLDDTRIAEALERISERLTGFTQFLDDYAKHNFDPEEAKVSIYLPAAPGWIIEWDEGNGPAQDRIVAWHIQDDWDSIPIPITSTGRETNMGEVGHIRHLDDIRA